MKVRGPVTRPVVVSKASDTPLSNDGVMRMLDEKTAALRADAARSLFVSSKMSDLPEAYRALLPASEDQAVLAAAEGKIRASYRDDMRVHGPFNNGYSQVTGDPSAYGPPASSMHHKLGQAQALAEQARAAGETPVKAETPPTQHDMNTMNSAQLFSLGLKQQEAAKTSGTGAAFGAGGGTSKVQTLPPSYVGASGSSLIAAALRGIR